MHIRDRYQHEPLVRQLVDAMTGMLAKSDITPHDLARCAVLAAEHHAMHHRQPVMLILAEHPEMARRYGYEPAKEAPADDKL